MKSGGTFKVAIVGLGYVGLPLANLFLEQGHEVYGIDADRKKIEKLLKHQTYLTDVTGKDVRAMFAGRRFHVGDAYDAASKADAVVICVPTPLNERHEPDLTYVKLAAEGLAPHLRRGQLVVLESSTYPGTTEEVLVPMLETTGLRVGEDLYVAYSPERIDPGQTQIALRDIPKVVGGVTEACSERAKTLYASAFRTVVGVSSARVAEMTKILENCQRLVNISFINELAMLAEKMDLNLWEAISAASTKPYGFTPYFPGPGIGGHCIPVDPLYLFWKAKAYDTHLGFIETAHRINEKMPAFVVEKTKKHLERRKPAAESSVLVLGVTYKKNVNDLRESTALRIISLLRKEGIQVDYHDPYVKEIVVDGVALKGVQLTKKTVSSHDAVLILTDHTGIPYDAVAASARLVIDTRNATAGASNKANVVLL